MNYQCPHCSKPIAGTEAFCSHCGGRLTMATAAGSASPATIDDVSNAAVPPVPAPSRSSRRGLVIGGSVLVLVAVAAALAFGAGLLKPPAAPGSLVAATSAPAPGAVSPACKSALRPLYDALSDLNSRLGVGLTFSEYSSKVGDAKVAYDQIPTSSLEQSCITLVGVPLEDALNAYIKADEAWNTCVSNALSCNQSSNTTALQAQWSIATTKIEQVKPLMLQ